MKKTKQHFIGWIKEQIKIYSPILNIQLHNIDVIERKTTEYVEIQCSYPYLDPIIYFGEKAFEDYLENKLNKDRILHELCHIITDPLYSKAIQRFSSRGEIEDERERLTDVVAAIIRKLIK